MRALVVDDEEPARAKLVRLLDDDGRFELAGEADDGVAAVAQIEELRPELLLLDVQMPGLSGFEVLRAVGAAACPKVIFSTAHDRYALEAFDAHAVDYLLKPYDADRFRIGDLRIPAHFVDDVFPDLTVGFHLLALLRVVFQVALAGAGPHHSSG